MIVADASWIIALRDPHDKHHTAAVRSDQAIGNERVLLPSLTFAECLVGPAKIGVLDQSAQELRAAFDVIESDKEGPLRWAALRASTNLRLPDAIVLDLALTRKARGIATFDGRLADCSIAHRLEVVGRTAP